ncbi:hypothetical protein I302_101508 [Kwoniella bestiolae CBS 10118]|uniref:TROVE domain-containing protein n=1 Tax=Kwoniella bestiolae CBS 10118 TaxID=1296100 RepID=A0A1B9GCF1_9TREE|nr:hypothetical protein I302_00192 [Kwoniella bestiolae CBS 10118]OCF28703.1 hypothetical protein I302_00192 [Kwoniella bestiolae CBS 10118]
MTTPITSSLEEMQLNAAPSSHPKTKKDWTLPPSFLSLLATPPHRVIDSLIPLNPTPSSSTSAPISAAPSAPFLEAMKGAPDMLTEKGAQAFSSTGSALVDLFNDFAPGIGVESLFNHLEKAWKEDPHATLKLIFQGRSIHEGKGWKEGFYRTCAWLWEYHPRTFLENLHVIVNPTCKRPRDPKRDEEKRQRREAAAAADNDGVLDLDDDGNVELDVPDEYQYPYRPHGTFKDLTDLLILHISGQISINHKGKITALDEGIAPAWQASTFKASRLALKADPKSKRNRSGFKAILKAAKKQQKEKEHDAFELSLWRAPSAAEKHKLLHQRAENALARDKKYQALYITVLHIFVKSLKQDLALLAKHQDFLKLPPHDRLRRAFENHTSPHLFGISYAAKWVPSPGKSGDRHTLFATALAHMLYPGDGVVWSREKLQKLVLSPLRKALAVPEVEMSNMSWNIDYTKVPSRSMVRNSNAFAEHDPEGFDKYLDRVSKGRTSISGASLMPHELLFDATRGDNAITKRLADLQWKTLVQSIRTSSNNRLSNCIAIADVSGSMGSFTYGQKKDPSPILPCIALTLLLGELAVAPWNGAFFTFSAEPKFETIEVSLPLSKRAETLSRAHWEMSTNFYKVFDLILATAKNRKMKPDDMVKKVFVFSDMQFDAAAGKKYGETEHDVIQRKFEEAGYPLPELVYWNLAPRYDGAPKPIPSDVPGVSLFSGFSGALMKYFLGQADLDEDATMEEVPEQEEDDDEDMVVLPRTMVSGERKDKSGKDKKKDSPLDTVMKVISAESFKDLKVVD